MTTKTRLHLLVLTLFACLYLLPLGGRPLMEPDETRYGEVPREMIAAGDWVVPHLNGLRYFEKPPLGYWANGLSILLFGENGFAIRLPSALSVGLSALLLCWLVRRYSAKDEAWAGPLAALTLLTCFEVAAVGTFSVLDSMLASALTLTLVCLFLASEQRRGSGQERWWLIAAGVSCGLAFLLKGFLALVVPALAMGAYLLWQRRWRDLLRLAWLPLLAATLTALPWSLAIHGREPDFWHYFFWVEHVRRFMGGEEAQHKESFWFFFTMAPAMFLPWTFLVPAAVLGLRTAYRRQESLRPLIRFALAWLCLPFLFFSLSSGKLLTYILPCFPPFAILVSIGLLALVDAGRTRAVQIGAAMAAMIFGLLPVALLVIQNGGLAKVPPPYAATWQWGLALAGLSAMALVPMVAYRLGHPRAKIILFGLGPALFLGLAAFLMPDQVNEKKSPGELLLRHRQEITADTVILADEEPLRAVCWFLRRADVLLILAGGEVSYGLGYPDAAGRLLGLSQAKATILAQPERTVLVARARNYREWAKELPTPKTIDDSGADGYIFATY